MVQNVEPSLILQKRHLQQLMSKKEEEIESSKTGSHGPSTLL